VSLGTEGEQHESLRLADHLTRAREGGSQISCSEITSVEEYDERGTAGLARQDPLRGGGGKGRISVGLAVCKVLIGGNLD